MNTTAASVASLNQPWYATITRQQWQVLAAAKLGWMLDAMDFMLYAMAIGRLKTYFGFDDATAGMLGTITLATSALGVIVFGVIADRMGRTRALMSTILIFGRKLASRTILVILLSSTLQFAYWGIFFWLPGFLSRPVTQGGAGMGIVGSLGWIIPVQIGAYLGYLTFGFIADRLGRHRTFILFMIAAAVLVPIYGQMARSPLVLMLLGPVLGYVGHGYFSMFGSFVAELFPTSVRATGQGTAYNGGRLMGAFAPYVIGVLATFPRIGIGLALASTSFFFLASALLIMTLPDRSGQPLES